MNKLIQIPLLDLAMMDHDLYFEMEARQRRTGQPAKGEDWK